jgi:hypothetical protein
MTSQGAWSWILCVMAAARLSLFQEPSVYGRGGTYLTHLASVATAPVDGAWNDVLPQGSKRAPIGPAEGAFDLVRWPSGASLREHARELYWTAIVLDGELRIRFDGDSDRSLSSWCFLMVPAGLGHAVRCAAGSDCLLLMFQGGPQNGVAESSTRASSSPISPDGIPPVTLRLSQAAWHEVGRGLWRGDPGGAGWARLSVGAADAELWRLAPGGSMEASAGGRRSSVRVGLLMGGALLFIPKGGESQHLRPPAYFSVPRSWTCQCVSETPCILLAD